jgi:signal transduction histidine kinase
MEAVGRLAGSVAHDFNNVLSVIKVKAELLRRQLEPDDPRRRHADDLAASADRGAALTRDLLTFGRQRVVNPEETDLVELLRRCEPSLRALAGAGVELRLDLPPEPLRGMAEPVELDRVLMNLVTNAQDAMPGGGRIDVALSRATLDAAAAAAAGVERPGAYAELSVADTGTGIAPEAQANLFEPFFTTKEPGKGTGLGLSIAYAILQQHDGAIRVASEPGKGSTFTLLIPLLPADERPS